MTKLTPAMQHAAVEAARKAGESFETIEKKYPGLKDGLKLAREAAERQTTRTGSGPTEPSRRVTLPTF